MKVHSEEAQTGLDTGRAAERSKIGHCSTSRDPKERAAAGMTLVSTRYIIFEDNAA